MQTDTYQCCMRLHIFDVLYIYMFVFQNLLKKQVETRTADGRRRITPLCIAQLDTGQENMKHTV